MSYFLTKAAPKAVRIEKFLEIKHILLTILSKKNKNIISFLIYGYFTHTYTHYLQVEMDAAHLLQHEWLSYHMNSQTFSDRQNERNKKYNADKFLGSFFFMVCRKYFHFIGRIEV